MMIRELPRNESGTARGTMFHGRWFAPRCRAVDHAAICTHWYYVGKLAFCRKVARNVLVVGGDGAKFLARPFMRIEHDYRFTCALLEVVKWCNEIRVARYENDAVEIALNVVNEHLGGDVYIRAYFFGFPDSCKRNLWTGLAGFFCEWIARAESLVVALDDFQLRTICRKGGKVYGLMHLSRGFCGVIVDSCRKVFDADDFVFFRPRQKGVCERHDIQPLEVRKPEQPVVKVESVNIDNGFLHGDSKRQGPDLSPALHRIAEAQRSVSNPSWGSVEIVSKSFRWCKAQNSKNGNLQHFHIGTLNRFWRFDGET